MHRLHPPRPTSDERRPPLLFRPLLDSDLHASVRYWACCLPNRSAKICLVWPPVLVKAIIPEREIEGEKARALHRSHQAPHHVIPHYHPESEEGTSLRHLDLACLFKPLLACARTTHCSLCLACCRIAETTPNIRPSPVLRVYIYGLTNRHKLRASSNRLTLFWQHIRLDRLFDFFLPR